MGHIIMISCPPDCPQYHLVASPVHIFRNLTARRKPPVACSVCSLQKCLTRCLARWRMNTNTERMLSAVSTPMVVCTLALMTEWSRWPTQSALSCVVCSPCCPSAGVLTCSWSTSGKLTSMLCTTWLQTTVCVVCPGDIYISCYCRERPSLLLLHGRGDQVVVGVVPRVASHLPQDGPSDGTDWGRSRPGRGRTGGQSGARAGHCQEAGLLLPLAVCWWRDGRPVPVDGRPVWLPP